jgi:hypothetical protein
MKKFLVLLLAACMLITCFACGGNNNEGYKPGKKPNADKWKDLPDYDFDGIDFRVSSRGSYGNMEVLVDDEDSENMIDQALIYRNARVEDRYNIYIELQENDATAFAHTNIVLSACTMQMDTFDLAMTYVYESAPLITNGFVLNWAKLPYTKLAESHWINGMNKEFSVRDAIYTSISKMCISILGQTSAMLYNRDLGDAWKGEEFSEQLIQTVLDGNGKEGGWTYDYLMNIVNEYGWNDATNDGRTADDTYAFYMTRDWSVNTWHAAWDIPCIKNTVEKGLEDVMMNDKYLSYASRMQSMYFETPGIFSGPQGEAISAFMSDRALFTTTALSDTLSVFPGMESTYTILPQPKYDDNQKDYRSAMFDNYSVMSIPITADSNFVSLIVEALSIASEANVYPAYRFDALQGTGVSDADSIDMLDIVLNNTTWDIATLLMMPLPRMISAVRYDIEYNPGNSQVSQHYDSVKGEIKDVLEDIMTAFDMFQDN